MGLDETSMENDYPLCLRIFVGFVCSVLYVCAVCGIHIGFLPVACVSNRNSRVNSITVEQYNTHHYPPKNTLTYDTITSTS